MTDKIEKLFNDIINYGFYSRSNSLDGLKQWTPLKKILSKSEEKGQWNPKVRELFVYMRSELKLQECVDEINADTEDEKNIIFIYNMQEYQL